MLRKPLIPAALIATLALAGSALTAAAQDEGPTMESLAGIIVAAVDEDGFAEYALELADGTQVTLSVGPPWYWTAGSPLADLVGQTVTVEGYMDDDPVGVVDLEDAGPELEVRVIDGIALWAGEAPPWAGGPAAVGEAHPGFDGWSQDRSVRGEDEASASLAGGPKVVGERHPGHKGWSRGQAAREAKASDRDRGRAMAESRRGGPKVQGESHPGYKGWSRGQAGKGGSGPHEAEDEGDV